MEQTQLDTMMTNLKFLRTGSLESRYMWKFMIRSILESSLDFFNEYQPLEFCRRYFAIDKNKVNFRWILECLQSRGSFPSFLNFVRFACLSANEFRIFHFCFSSCNDYTKYILMANYKSKKHKIINVFSGGSKLQAQLAFCVYSDLIS